MSEAGKKPDEAVKWSENLNNYVIKYLIIMSKYRTVFQGMFGEEKVVIKVSRLTKRPTDKIYLQRELEFLRSANHPNIRDFCPIKEPSLAETHSFYASTHAYELPVLLDLRREEIGKKDDSDSDEVELPLSEKCVQQMANQIISGLSYLHKQGFLHSRLRKDYITLSEDGTVKLIGFARMALIDEDDDQVDIRNGFTGETYEIEDESFFLGLLCVELLLDESPFDPDVLFGRPTSRRLRQYQQEYKAMKKRRIFSLPAIFPDGDPDKMEKLERNLSLEGRSFLEKTIFSSKDSRPTCEQLKEHAWIKGKDGVDVIVDELVHRGATERADYILRRENAVMWFESMKLGNGRILISILGSIYSKPSSHLYLPFTAPMPMEHNMAEVRQIVEYNLLQMLGLAITNVQFFHLVEKIMEKMDIVSRVPYVVLREVIGFPTGDKTDVVNGLTDCVMVFVTKDKYEFHQFLKTNWPKVYRLYSDKFYGHESMATDIEHLNKAFPRYDSLPTRIAKSEEKVETAAGELMWLEKV
uniref:Protein kinase domain-containing protein n=1 Tax=Bursaphelenchus xylophilus TaxID=6326 RepID=A0A1I7RJY6_BURXY